MDGTLAGSPMWVVSLAGAFLGALAGGGSLWLMGWTWENLRHRSDGTRRCKDDVYGRRLPCWRLIFTIFIGVLSGSVIGILLMARQRERNMQMLLPFGVFLTWRNCRIAIRDADREPGAGQF